MLLLAAFSLLGSFRLARTVANSIVAACSTVLVAIYPVFFAQSSLAQVDLPAAGLIFWGLEAYFRGKNLDSGIERETKMSMGVRVSSPVLIWFSLAALAKETAILIPVALVLWEPSAEFNIRNRGRAALQAQRKL